MSVGPEPNPRIKTQSSKTMFKTLCNFLHLDRLEAAKETPGWISVPLLIVASFQHDRRDPPARNVFVG